MQITGITNKELRALFNSDTAASLLLDAVGAGPFDGGCLIVAKAYVFACGGSLVRIVSRHTQTEHYGALIDGEVYDGNGRRRSTNAWLRWFEREYPDCAPVQLAHGFDVESETQDLPHVSNELAQMLINRLAADC